MWKLRRLGRVSRYGEVCRSKNTQTAFDNGKTVRVVGDIVTPEESRDNFQ